MPPEGKKLYKNVDRQCDKKKPISQRSVRRGSNDKNGVFSYTSKSNMVYTLPEFLLLDTLLFGNLCSNWVKIAPGSIRHIGKFLTVNISGLIAYIFTEDACCPVFFFHNIKLNYKMFLTHG